MCFSVTARLRSRVPRGRGTAGDAGDAEGAEGKTAGAVSEEARFARCCMVAGKVESNESAAGLHGRDGRSGREFAHIVLCLDAPKSENQNTTFSEQTSGSRRYCRLTVRVACGDEYARGDGQLDERHYFGGTADGRLPAADS